MPEVSVWKGGGLSSTYRQNTLQHRTRQKEGKRLTVLEDRFACFSTLLIATRSLSIKLTLSVRLLMVSFIPSSLRLREGLGAGTARSALTVLALALGGLRGVICVKHRGPSVPGLVCLHFFEASSRTWGHSRHSYSLAIMQSLLRLLGVSVSVRRLTGYGSEYYLQPLRRSWRSLTLFND